MIAKERRSQEPAFTLPKYRRVVALIPAHDEIEQIGATITALLTQTRVPDEIVVCLDNAPVELEFEAGQYPVRVTTTEENTHKKGGNLNQNLAGVLPGMRATDVIMGFDADSVPNELFVENALAWIDRGYGAVGATFHGRSGGGVLGLLQRAEFGRFARSQHRKQRCDVLSGTGWAVPVGVLNAVTRTRTDRQVYDVRHITEDFELTLAIRHLGYKAISPSNCSVRTDVMETFRDWDTQRLRWQTGTLNALREYGWTKVTTAMIVRQIFIYLFGLATPLTAFYLGWSFYLFGWRGIDPANAPLYALGIGLVVVEQSWQSRKAGVGAVLLSLLVLPDLLYSIARQVVYARSLYRFLARKDTRWGAGMDI